jgi:hypothetical protein
MVGTKVGVMARLNLTLDADTIVLLEKHARQAGTRRATIARNLLREAIARREAAERQRKLAADYAAERASTRELLRELEAGQLELLD